MFFLPAMWLQKMNDHPFPLSSEFSSAAVSPTARAARCIWALVVILATESIVMGGSGLLLVKPDRGIRPTSKLQMFLDTTWLAGPGMRQVKVVFRPIRSRTFPADRRLRIEVIPAVWHSYLGTRLVASREILLPEGAESSGHSIYVPQEADFVAYRLKVYENGRLLRDLSERHGVQVPNPNWSYGSDGDIALAVVDKDVPSVYSRRTSSGGIRLPVQGQDVTNVANAAWLSVSQYAGNQYPRSNARWSDISQTVPGVEFFHPTRLTLRLGRLVGL